MAKINLYNIKGEKKETLNLDDSVFNLPANNELVHQVAVSLGANQRKNLAHTKTRAERSGSGIKPWRQKGTGRARVGSVRTPVWRKGGVAFGPRSDRNYKQKINKKMKAKAIATVLSGKLRDNEIVAVEEWKLENKKTKEMHKILKKLKVNGSVLMAFLEKENELGRVSRNIPKVKNIMTEQLNVFDMINKKILLLSKESLLYLEEKYKKDGKK